MARGFQSTESLLLLRAVEEIGPVTEGMWRGVAAHYNTLRDAATLLAQFRMLCRASSRTVGATRAQQIAAELENKRLMTGEAERVPLAARRVLLERRRARERESEAKSDDAGDQLTGRELQGVLPEASEPAQEQDARQQGSSGGTPREPGTTGTAAASGERPAPDDGARPGAEAQPDARSPRLQPVPVQYRSFGPRQAPRRGPGPEYRGPLPGPYPPHMRPPPPPWHRLPPMEQGDIMPVLFHLREETELARRSDREEARQRDLRLRLEARERRRLELEEAMAREERFWQESTAREERFWREMNEQRKQDHEEAAARHERLVAVLSIVLKQRTTAET